MKILGIFFISLFLFCCQNQSLYKPSREEMERQTHIDIIRKKVAFQMKDEYGLIPCGIGGRTSNGVEMLGLSFNLRKHVTIDEGRELIVRVVEQLVSEINEDEKLQSHLVFKPFEPRNVEVRIFLPKAGDSAPDPGELFIIEATNGFVTFLTEDKKSEPFRVVHKETFEEAVNRSKSRKLESSEIFSPSKNKPLHGKILDGRYYSPKNIFSCQADKFGQKKYISQDLLMDNFACVGFYNSRGNFKKAEVVFSPEIESKNLDKNALRKIFENFGIGILETVDNAQGIEILQEQFIEDQMLFVALSIQTMDVLKINGKHPASTRSYLVFQEKDKIVLLSNQIVSEFCELHLPEDHITNLKIEILDFRKTFEFNPVL